MTNRPAPYTPLSFTTKSSPNSVPITVSVSKPSPPSMRTGAFTVKEMKSAPCPPLMLVNGAFGSFGSTLTKARTVKVSSSSSPNRNSSALLL